MEATINKTATVVKPDFGNGRYSPLMEEVYADAQTVFKVDSAKAEKLARVVANDVGAAMASCPVDVRLGKLNKDGRLTIAEVAKMKGIVITKSIGVLRALRYTAEAGQYGFSFANTEWQPVSWLAEYLAKL